MASKIVVFVEVKNSKVKKGSLELLSQGRRFAEALGGGDVTAVLVGGASVSEYADALGRAGADRVQVAAADWLEGWNGEAVARIMSSVVALESPEIVLVSATLDGKDLAPRLAASLDVGLASDVTGAELVDGRLALTRPMYAGKTYTSLSLSSTPQLASVRPNSFAVSDEDRSAATSELALDFGPDALGVKVVKVEAKASEKPDLTEAERIVSGGRGLKGPENFPLLESFADEIGATVGASRAVVDAGWRGHGDQVGQTGKTVSPNLYFAVAISGAIQHLAGMSTSKCIVAVNKDPEAPIFKVADYGIVGDLFEVMPALTEEVKKLKA
jgi:electron transfer flavoprotein alpha subunit